jgi:hypothetical protein
MLCMSRSHRLMATVCSCFHRIQRRGSRGSLSIAMIGICVYRVRAVAVCALRYRWWQGPACSSAVASLQCLPAQQCMPRHHQHSTPLPCLLSPGLSLAVALMVCLLCSFGGFGSDFCSGNTAEMWRDRCEFVRLAAVKAGTLHPGSLAGRVHVGDTPMDVAAALGAGAGALGVTTGEGGCHCVGVACMVHL